MTRTLVAEIAIATVLSFTTFPSSFAGASQLSNTGTQTGIAACYSHRLVGHRTASGKRYNSDALTAAHARIPLGSRVRITNIENGKSVVVLVNDKMSAHAGGGIIMDVSKRACRELGFGRGGEARVRLEVVNSNAATK